MLRHEKIKIFWLFFTIYFASLSFGLPLYKHYCLGNLKKVQFFIQPESCHTADHHDEIKDCCSGKCSSDNDMEEALSFNDGDCCTNKFEFYKIDITSTKEEIQKFKVQKPLLFLNNNYIHFSFLKFAGKTELLQYNKFILFRKLPDPRIKLILYQQFIC